ncbi:contractile injection system tape measure protein [Mucilaginibacter angelicae]|uniref:Contractile injection system tape measure protein n=1 Tax=Mucilaginibacter angelicae TaxID=869718 RepID=A0ABV6LF29_9SPHI
MSEQVHIIKRILIDLDIHDRLPANQIQDESATILKKLIAPMVGDYLDLLTADGTDIRIDCWEIDLGMISAHSLETDLTERLAQCLAADEQLIMAKQQSAGTNHESQMPGHTDAELVVYFLQTGMLPWWAKNPSSQTFTQALNTLLATQPAMLHNIILQTPDMVMLERLINTLNNEQLHHIAVLFNPTYPPLTELYLQIARSIGIAAENTNFRQAWWANVLYYNQQYASHAYHTQYTARPGHGRYLASASPLTQIFFNALARQETDIGNSADDDRYHQLLKMYTVFAETLVLLTENGICPDLTMHPEQLKDIQYSISRLATQPTYLQQSVLHARHLWDNLGLAMGLSRPTAQHHPKKTNAGTGTDGTTGKITVSTEPEPSKTGSGQSASNVQQTEDEAGLPGSFAAQHPNQNTDMSSNQSDQVAGPASENTIAAKLISQFTATERFSVSHAGLILLWPFLSHFFSALNLIDKGAFYDKQSQYKACMLLLYVAMGDDLELFEGHLPVIKLLCGLELTEWVDMQTDITQHDMDEADHMLEAVIGHAPMWSGLSLAGLRQAYLQRPGILSIRDGNWLLQVERQNHDILTDRLPWSNNLIKLPWLEHLIFVEWQQD